MNKRVLRVPPGFRPGWLPCPCGRVHPVPTRETLDAFRRAQSRVPWGRTSGGEEVHTNGILEDALGLSPYINGWGGDEGYYVDPGHRAEVAAEIVRAVDWDRVARFKGRFAIPFNRGDRPGMLFGSRLLLGHDDWTALARLCYRSVPAAEFEARAAALWAAHEAALGTYRVRSSYRGRPLVADVRATSVHEAQEIAWRQWEYSGPRSRIRAERVQE